MKTFEEIKEHLSKNVYGEIDTIFTFLEREGIKKEEIWSINYRRSKFNFKDFLKWYDSENSSKKPIFDANAFSYTFLRNNSEETNKKYKISGEKRKLMENDLLLLAGLRRELEDESNKSENPFAKSLRLDLINFITKELKVIESELNATVD